MTPAVVSHYDATPGHRYLRLPPMASDLGFISTQINKLVADTPSTRSRGGSKVTVRGQIKTMSDSFIGLLVGLAGRWCWCTC